MSERRPNSPPPQPPQQLRKQLQPVALVRDKHYHRQKQQLTHTSLSRRMRSAAIGRRNAGLHHAEGGMFTISPLAAIVKRQHGDFWQHDSQQPARDNRKVDCGAVPFGRSGDARLTTTR